MRSEKEVIRQANRFDLDPNRAQRVLLPKSVGASRYVYNWELAESKRQYELTGKRPRLGDLKRQLVELKQTDAPWLYEVSAHVGQSALRDLNVAFERFFKGFDGRVLSAAITRRADRWFVSLCVERNRSLALSISDAGMGELRRQLTYKSEWYGSTLVVAHRFYPSSKLCSGCGVIKSTLSLSERSFDCKAHGVSLDRDENAAINLRRLALGGLPADRREVTPVDRKALTLASASVKPASVKQEATADGARRSTRRSTSKGVLVRV